MTDHNRTAPWFDDFDDAVAWGKENFGADYAGVTERFFSSGRVACRPFAETKFELVTGEN